MSAPVTIFVTIALLWRPDGILYRYHEQLTYEERYRPKTLLITAAAAAAMIQEFCKNMENQPYSPYYEAASQRCL